MKRILVVDDDADILSSLEFSLEDRYHVDVALNGAQALEKLQQNRFDALLVDLMMPVMSGEKLIGELRARGNRTPVMVLSAAMDLPARARKIGVTDFISKPFDFAVLERKLERVIDSGRAPASASTATSTTIVPSTTATAAAAPSTGAGSSPDTPASAPLAPAAAPSGSGDVGNRFRLLVESTIDYAIFMLDPDGKVLTWNAGAERLKGYRAEEIIGRSFTALYPPEDVAAGKPERELRIARSEGRVEDEGLRIRKDGTAFWANCVITALRDAQGRLTGFGKVTRDLTERRRAESELRESEERFRLIVERVSDYAIFMLDPEGRVATWNVGAERIKGYRPEEIIGRHFRAFYGPEDVASCKPERELEAALRDGRAEDEGWRIRKDGTRFWANVVITALRDPSGALRGFAKVTRDMTAAREAEAAARELVRVQEAARTRAAFVNMMAHEIRTPLTSVKLFLEGIRRRVKEKVPEVDGLFVRLKAQLDRFQGMVNDLGDTARLESGRELTMKIGTVDLAEIVRDMVRLRTDTLSANEDLRHAITLDSPPGPMPILADRGRIEQVFSNLLENAIKYSPLGGPIVVRLEREEGGFRVDVRDTGIGIPTQDLERIAEPYFRASNVSSENFGGMGLGLSICADLVRRHGGKLEFSSSAGGGTTATIRLPRAR